MIKNSKKMKCGISVVAMIAMFTASNSFSSMAQEPIRENVRTANYTVGSSKESIVNSSKKQGKSYMVMSKSKAICDELLDEYEQVETVADVPESTLEQEGIAVLDIDEKEIQDVEKLDEEIIIEEDINIVANAKSKKKNAKELRKKIEQKKKQKSKEEIYEWNMDAINASDVETSNQNKVKVAILDSGIGYTDDVDVVSHINLIPGEEELGSFFEDVTGHGTSVASIIAAKDNNVGITGVNSNVELYSVKVLDDSNTAPLSRIIQGIYWCIDNDINIINMSFGTTVKSEIFEKAINDAYNAGILIVAAAGNTGGQEDSTVEYPAAYENVIAVGSVNANSEKAEHSAEGDEVELVAPGEKILVNDWLDDVYAIDGTSMAVPHVVGVASVLWQKDSTKSNDFIRGLLNESARELEDQESTGNGLIDLQYALEVYDSYEEVYSEAKKMISKPIEENKSELITYDTSYVSARWDKTLHDDLFDDYDNAYYIKQGAFHADTWLKYKSGVTEEIHGHSNYIATYIYLMDLATKCKSVGLKNALDNTKFPNKVDKDEESCGRVKSAIFSIMEREVDNGTKIKNLKNIQQARVIVGIATHVVADVYAHKTYVPINGSWIQLTSKSSYGSRQDDTTFVSARWKTAKEAVDYVVCVWYSGTYADIMEFTFLENHKKGSFKLYCFWTYAKRTDKYNYIDDEVKQWIKDRSSNA